MPDPEYRRAAGASNSMLKVWRERCSPEYTLARLAKPKETTAAFAFGKALHASLLTPQLPPTYVVMPADAPKYPTKAQLNAKKPSPETLDAIAWWKNFDEANKGLDVLDATGNYGGTRLAATIKRFKEHPMAVATIADGKPEVSVFAPFNLGGTIMRKMRADFVCTGPTIVDLKSSMDCSPKCVGKRDEFSAQLFDLDYDMQSAYYLDTYNAANPGDIKENFVFVAMDWDEDTGFVGIRVLHCTDAVIKSGRDKYIEALQAWMEAERSGWKIGYPEEVTMLNVPEFVAKKYNTLQLV